MGLVFATPRSGPGFYDREPGRHFDPGPERVIVVAQLARHGERANAQRPHIAEGQSEGQESLVSTHIRVNRP